MVPPCEWSKGHWQGRHRSTGASRWIEGESCVEVPGRESDVESACRWRVPGRK